MTKHPVYWTGPVGDRDDFGSPITNDFIDGKTRMGKWAIMTQTSYSKYGVGLGLGRGQRFRLQPDGKWLKVEG